MSQWQLSPIMIALINKKNNQYLVQNKDGLMLVLQITAGTTLDIVRSYNIDMVGFTKLALPIHDYNPSGKLTTSMP
jgi:hypothetical protein